MKIIIYCLLMALNSYFSCYRSPVKLRRLKQAEPKITLKEPSKEGKKRKHEKAKYRISKKGTLKKAGTH